jgi:hypothetical protein
MLVLLVTAVPFALRASRPATAPAA